MDMDYSILRWSDKPYVCYGTSGPKARDAVELAAIACGGREAIERDAGDHRRRQPEQPAGLGLPHGGRAVRSGRGEPAGGRHAVPAGRGDRARSASPAAWRCRWPRRCPASRSCRRSGRARRASSARSSRPSTCAPAGPRSARPSRCSGTLAGGQLARRYGLPYRGGGGLCSSNALDAAGGGRDD